jgi:hypothetical protein
VPFGWAAAIGGGLSAVGSVASGLIGSSASKAAASQQAEAQQAALDLQTREFNTTQQNITPWVNSGTNALQQYNSLLGLNPGGNPVSSNPFLTALGIGGPGPMGSIDPSTFTGSPGYQYALQAGQRSIIDQGSPGRGPGGGNQLMALQHNAEGLASQNYGNWLSNVGTGWQSLLQNIKGQSDMGLSAAGVLAGDSQNYANAAGNNLGNIGNANAQGTMNSASALGGGITGALNNLNSGFGSNSGSGGLANALAQLFGGGGGGFAATGSGTGAGGSPTFGALDA